MIVEKRIKKKKHNLKECMYEQMQEKEYNNNKPSTSLLHLHKVPICFTFKYHNKCNE